MALPKIIKLQGGATLIYKRRTINKATALTMFFKTGSMHDGKLLGRAHFAEHLLANKTKNLTLEEVREKHQKLETEMNARTGYKDMSFCICCANNKLEEGVKLLCDQVFEPGFDEKIFNTEKQVILKELARRLDNDESMATIMASSTAFPNSYHKNLILGTEDCIQKMQMDDIHNFTNNHLTLQNMVVCVTGRISKAKAIKLVNKYIISKIAGRSFKPEPHNFSFEFANKSKLVIKTKERPNANIKILFPMQIGKTRAENRIFGPISYLLNDFAGLLFKVLRDEKGLVYTASCASANNKEYACYVFDIQSSPDNINKIFPAIAEIFDRLKMTEKKLIEYKDSWKIIEDKKLPGSLINTCYFNFDSFDYYGNFVKSKDYDKWLKKLTVDDVNAYIAKIREQKKVFISVVSKLTEKEIMPIEDIEKLFF